jgi:hypothetical protein
MDDPIFSGKVCPYCGKNTAYVDSSIVYRRSFGKIYYCRDCRAWVGVHKGTDRALGRLADKELREWKIRAHFLFDRLWKKKVAQGFSKKEARLKAYTWLSKELKIGMERTHIGMFDVDECKKVVDLCKEYFK